MAARTLISLQKTTFSISSQTSLRLNGPLAWSWSGCTPPVTGPAQPLLPHLLAGLDRDEKINPASAKHFRSCLGAMRIAGRLLPTLAAAVPCFGAQSSDAPGSTGPLLQVLLRVPPQHSSPRSLPRCPTRRERPDPACISACTPVACQQE